MHVAISPISSTHSPFKLVGKQLYKSPKYYKKSKNLTIIKGAMELEWKHFNNLFEKATKLRNIKTKLFEDLHHGDMASNHNIEKVGSAVVEGCGY